MLDRLLQHIIADYLGVAAQTLSWINRPSSARRVQSSHLTTIPAQTTIAGKVLSVASELRWICAAGSQSGVALPGISGRSRRNRLAVAMAPAGWLLALAAMVAAAMVWSRARTAGSVTKLQIAEALDESSNQPLAVSPDGRKVAMIVPGEPPHLALRDLDSGETRQLSGTEGGIYPFWAPDGHAIAFFIKSRATS